MPDTFAHRRRVALQQRVHEARRLLLEAADHLLEVDAAARGDDAHRAATSHEHALALLDASHHQVRALGGELRGEPVRAPRPRVAALPLDMVGALSRPTPG